MLEIVVSCKNDPQNGISRSRGDSSDRQSAGKDVEELQSLLQSQQAKAHLDQRKSCLSVSRALALCLCLLLFAFSFARKLITFLLNWHKLLDLFLTLKRPSYTISTESEKGRTLERNEMQGEKERERG